jgi:hypothetical protein
MGYRVHEGGSSLDPATIVRCARLIEQVHGTAVDWGRLHRWLAESFLRMDARAEALGQFARAALRGQVRGVASDLLAILRRRVATRMSGGGVRGGTSAQADWIAAASAWLQDLQRFDPIGVEDSEPGDRSRGAPG